MERVLLANWSRREPERSAMRTPWGRSVGFQENEPSRRGEELSRAAGGMSPGRYTRPLQDMSRLTGSTGERRGARPGWNPTVQGTADECNVLVCYRNAWASFRYALRRLGSWGSCWECQARRRE
jgi:hypothetical protein